MYYKTIRKYPGVQVIFHHKIKSNKYEFWIDEIQEPSEHYNPKVMYEQIKSIDQRFKYIQK